MLHYTILVSAMHHFEVDKLDYVKEEEGFIYLTGEELGEFGEEYEFRIKKGAAYDYDAEVYKEGHGQYIDCGSFDIA